MAEAAVPKRGRGNGGLGADMRVQPDCRQARLQSQLQLSGDHVTHSTCHQKYRGLTTHQNQVEH